MNKVLEPLARCCSISGIRHFGNMLRQENAQLWIGNTNGVSSPHRVADCFSITLCPEVDYALIMPLCLSQETRLEEEGFMGGVGGFEWMVLGSSMLLFGCYF